MYIYFYLYLFIYSICCTGTYPQSFMYSSVPNLVLPVDVFNKYNAVSDDDVVVYDHMGSCDHDENDKHGRLSKRLQLPSTSLPILPTTYREDYVSDIRTGED